MAIVINICLICFQIQIPREVQPYFLIFAGEIAYFKDDCRLIEDIMHIQTKKKSTTNRECEEENMGIKKIKISIKNIIQYIRNI